MGAGLTLLDLLRVSAKQALSEAVLVNDGFYIKLLYDFSS